MEDQAGKANNVYTGYNLSKMRGSKKRKYELLLKLCMLYLTKISVLRITRSGILLAAFCLLSTHSNFANVLHRAAGSKTEAEMNFEKKNQII